MNINTINWIPLITITLIIILLADGLWFKSTAIRKLKLYIYIVYTHKYENNHPFFLKGFVGNLVSSPCPYPCPNIALVNVKPIAGHTLVLKSDG